MDTQLSESEKLNRFFARLIQEALKGAADEIEFRENNNELVVEVRRKGSIYKTSSMKLSWFEAIQNWLRDRSINANSNNPADVDQWKTHLLLSNLNLECAVLFKADANQRRALLMSKFGNVVKLEPRNSLGAPVSEPKADQVIGGDFFTFEKDVTRVVPTKPLVMIVEDDADQRSIIEMVLKEHDYEVVTASDGIEALRVLGRTRPDLIVSDLMMPNLDGSEFVRRLKSDKRLSAIPVLILTVINDMEKEFQLLSLGVDDYCEKTVQRKILLKRIENLLKRAKG